MKKIYKTILITGASSGLGKKLAESYAKEGITLFLTGRNKTRLLETSNLCESKGAYVISKNIDITNKEEIKNWILECDELKHVDLIIANAGISTGTSMISESNDIIYDIYNTNIFGTLNTVQPIISKMVERKNGQIAIVSSMSSFIGLPSCPAYSSSKACLTAYGEALRGVLKKYNVGVSIICPGFIKTPLTDKNDFKMPLLMSTEYASKKIIKGLSKNKGLIAFPFIMYLALKILKLLPFSLSNYIVSKLPEKTTKE